MEGLKSSTILSFSVLSMRACLSLDPLRLNKNSYETAIF